MKPGRHLLHTVQIDDAEVSVRGNDGVELGQDAVNGHHLTHPSNPEYFD